jgi:cytochrome c556
VNLSKKTWSFAAAAAAALLASGPATAQFKSTDDAIGYRQGALAVMGNHFGRIGAIVSGKAPFDARSAQVNADLVVTLAHLPWSAFIDGSDKGDTNARPEVWSQADRFRAASQKFEAATVKLAAAAKSGKPDELKVAFNATADTCKSCHDDFRKRH